MTTNRKTIDALEQQLAEARAERDAWGRSKYNREHHAMACSLVAALESTLEKELAKLPDDRA